ATASRPAAASAAAHNALVHLFPANAASFDALNAAILAGIPDGPRKRAGIVWGEFVATVILFARANDGSNAVVPSPSGNGPGVWIPTPPAFLPYCCRNGDSLCRLERGTAHSSVLRAHLLQIASSTRRITTRLRNSARLSAPLAQKIKPRSPCSGPMAQAPRRLPAIGTALRRLS